LSRTRHNPREIFRIPAGDPNWESPVVEGKFNVDAELVWFMPHMHLRGKDMTYGGTQDWEEMMVPFLGVVVDSGVDPRKVMTLPGQIGPGGG
jgi:hypothetical protein